MPRTSDDHAHARKGQRSAYTRIALSAAILFLSIAASDVRAGNIFDENEWTPPAPRKITPPPQPASTIPPTVPANAAQSTPTTTSPPPESAVTPTPKLSVHHSIPGKDEQAASRKAFRELFSKELADRSPAGRRTLGAKLLEESAKVADVPADQFVLLVGANEAGKEAGDLGICARAADSLGDAFEVDGLQIKLDTLAGMRLKADSPAARDESCRAGLAMVDQLLVSMEYTAAAKLCALLRPLATSEPALTKRIESRAREIEGLKAIAEKLKKSPDDPAANLTLGKVICYNDAAWERGLPMLAKGSDAPLAELAMHELARPTNTVAVKDVGDGWWAISEKLPEPAKSHVQKHSLQFYSAILPNLVGIEKLAIEKRFADSGFLVSPVGEVQQFSGHSKGVHAVVFMPDSRQVISAGWDRIIRLWDVSSAQEIRQFTGHTKEIAKLSLSADGKVLASAGYDGTVRIWSVSSGTQTGLFKHDREVDSVAISSDGRFVEVGDFGGHTTLYDVASSRRLNGVNGHDGYAAAISPSGRYLASGGEDSVVHIWDLRSPVRRLYELKQAGQVKSLAFTPDEQQVVSAADPLVNVWDVASGKEARHFTGHTSTVRSVAVSPDGRSCLSSGEDGTIRLWDMATGEQILRFDPRAGRTIWCVAFSPNGRLAAAAGEDGTVRVFRLPDRE